MSHPHRLRLTPRLPSSSRIRRDQSRKLRLRPSWLRHQRRRLRPVKRDRARPAVVVGVEVAADLVRRSQLRPQLQPNHRSRKCHQPKRLPRNL